MSARLADTSVPVSQPKEDAPTSPGGDTASGSVNTISAYKVYAMHGLLLSGIELALTVGNALNQEAFQLNSFSALIFGGSVVIEAVGFAFAMGMAVMALLNPVAPGIVGVGVPAMVIVEAMVVEGSNDEMQGLCAMGLCAQSLCFLTFAVVSFIVSPSSVPTVTTGLWIAMAMACASILFGCYRRRAAGHPTFELFLFAFIAVPFVVEISESALLFTSASTPFVSYLLAVLDLVMIAPAAAMCFLVVLFKLVELTDN